VLPHAGPRGVASGSLTPAAALHVGYSLPQIIPLRLLVGDSILELLDAPTQCLPHGIDGPNHNAVSRPLAGVDDHHGARVGVFPT
jgi:hypothetical protein